MNAVRKLGPFELGPKIGRGGMASVYLARDPRPAAPYPVLAVKVMRDELATDHSYVSMFLDEARILSRLDHPNLISVVEAGVAEVRDRLGQPQPLDEAQTQAAHSEYRFIAMELLLGRPLSDVWDELAAQGRTIPLRVAAAIAARVAHGLHFAHELIDDDGESYQLVHRDVNPTNVFLNTDGRVKLIDFGLARARDTTAAARQGVVTGKLTYLAPEQLTHRASDRRTDVYQLGITLWEMVTGKRLFLRDHQLQSVAAIKRGEVPLPEQVHAAVPPELSRIVMRALATDPERRFTSMIGFARALDRWLEAHGGAVDNQAIGEVLEQAFPGEAARLDGWYRSVLSVPSAHAPEHTMAPPAGTATAPQLPATPPHVPSFDDDDAFDDDAVTPRLQRDDIKQALASLPPAAAQDPSDRGHADHGPASGRLALDDEHAEQELKLQRRASWWNWRKR